MPVRWSLRACMPNQCYLPSIACGKYVVYGKYVVRLVGWVKHCNLSLKLALDKQSEVHGSSGLKASGGKSGHN